MRSFLFLLLALLIAVPAFAVSEPVTINPMVDPPAATETVYGSTTIPSNAVVIWDIASSSGDNDYYVTIGTTADSALVAGVALRNFGAPTGNVGRIAVRGVVDVLKTAALLAPGDLICTSTSGGRVAVCSSKTDDSNAVGFVTEAAAPSANTVKAYLFGR